MLKKNINLSYPVSLILSTGKKNFESIGRYLRKSGDTIARWIQPAEKSTANMYTLAKQFFAHKNKLYIIIDDTLIKKVFSQSMQGTCFFYDTKLSKKVLAYKLLTMAITDGKYTLPLQGSFVFAKELMTTTILSKDDLVKCMVMAAYKHFSDKQLIVLCDGAFASVEMIQWFVQQNIAIEMRMHSNRVVLYQGKLIALRDIKKLTPTGRHMARTISVLWHNIPLCITAQRRRDKHGNETVVYQVSTYQAQPKEHVKNYQKRWGVEMLFRTTKQHLGLGECCSCNIDTQLYHMNAVLLAYAITQLERCRRKLDTPEEALRALKKQKCMFDKYRFASPNEIFGAPYA